MEEEDLQIENILEKKEVKKKVNGKDKGNRTELGLCKLLTQHFGQDFTRSVGSGNRWSQANLPEYAKQVFSGDICVPEGFSWVIESKGGYENEVDLNNVTEGKISMLDTFIAQCCKDAEYCGRKPIVCWKRNRKPWIVVIEQKWFPMEFWEKNFPYRVCYGDWYMISLEKLLQCTDKDFWFNKAKS